MALRTKLDQKLIGYITTFEQVTHARVKDVFVSEFGILFVVQHGDAGRAIGRRGLHIKRLTHLLRKRIKVVELSGKVEEFVKGMLDPLNIDSMEMKGSMVVLHVKDGSVKGKIIGRHGKNLRLLNDLLERYFHARAVVA